jgi:hypothetical protein
MEGVKMQDLNQEVVELRKTENIQINNDLLVFTMVATFTIDNDRIIAKGDIIEDVYGYAPEEEDE